MKAILLDLDGTLSHMDTHKFLKTYIYALAQNFTKWIEPKDFMQQVMRSTEVMVRNSNPNRTNKEVFLEDFSAAVQLEEKFLWEIFYRFYAEDFSQFRKMVTTNPVGRELVITAKTKGWKVAVASNPVHPKVAMEERVRWGGLEPQQVDFVPSIEEMHYCKPNPLYFAEVAQAVGVNPTSCIMVGNDEKEDLVASKIGMKTFCITADTKEVKADYKGKLEGFLNLIKTDKINI